MQNFDDWELITSDWGHSMRDWGHNNREGEDWTVHCTLVKYNKWKANSTACDVSKVKTVLDYVARSESWKYNVLYSLSAHSQIPDHTKKQASAGSRGVNYSPRILNVHSCPATQPWEEWSLEMQQLTERLRFTKPDMHTLQVFNYLSTLQLHHTVYLIEPCEANTVEHSQGVQLMRGSSCWFQRRRNQLLSFVRL